VKLTRRLAAACAALACAALSGCSPARIGAGNGSASWGEPGVLRIAISGVPRTLNPILSTTTFEGALARLNSSILVTADAQGRPVPDLASVVPTRANGGISADGLRVTYKLRPGVRWQDGVAFTSRDVAFTFGAIMNSSNDVISRHGYDIVSRVETPDPLTVVFHLKRRFAPFVATVFGESDSPYGLLPAHLLARYHSLNDVPFNAKPVGTGPFRLVEWRRGDSIEYEAFDGYFRGKPGLRRIVVRLIPDENTEVTQLRSHEIDLMLEASLNAYRIMRTLPGTKIVRNRINGYEGLLFNTARAPTSDPRVRRAVALALDRRALNARLTFGSGEPAVADLPSWMWAFDSSLKPPPYDPGEARKLLQAAGYGPHGKPLALSLYFDQSLATTRSASVQVQAALAAIGVEVRLHPQLNTILYAAYGAGGTLTHGNYDVAFYPWVAGVDPDNSSQFTCAARGSNGFNQSGYCSRAMDAAQEEALGEYDLPQRKAAYARIERLLVEDIPLNVLWWPANLHAVNPALRGFDPNPVNEMWNAWSWSL
jgi:peptide/nickel transport system substrate-binding protein